MNAQSSMQAQKQDFSLNSYPHLDAIETSGQLAGKSSYRDFMTDSCKADIDFNRLVYSCIDDDEYTEKTKQFDSCRDYAWFVRNKNTGEVRVQASACRLRWCPLCIRTKKMIIVQETRKWLSGVKRPKFLTFTLKHKDIPLREIIAELYKYFRSIRRAKWFKKNVRGGIWFFQITKSKKDGLWHPHIHCLVDSNFLPKAELSELWELITGDSKIVDIRQVKDNKKTAEYVARYAATPCRLSNFNVDDAIEIVKTLHGKRLCGTWGTGRTMSFKITKPDDWLDWERIGNWWVVWNDKANPLWCQKIRACWLWNKKLEWLPPPDLMGQVPWDPDTSIAPEPFLGNQLDLF